MSPPVLLLVSALAASADNRLSEARQLADEFHYDQAIKIAEAALQLRDISRETLIGLYELTGVAQATLQRPVRAREAFLKLLLIAPEHQLSRNLPPRTRTPYFEARTQAARVGAVALTADPPSYTDGRVTELAVRFKDNSVFPARAVRFTVSEDGAAPRVEEVAVSDAARRVVLRTDGRALKWSAELLGERDVILQRVERVDAAPPAPVAGLEAPPRSPPPNPVSSEPVTSPPTASEWMRPGGLSLAAVGLAALGTGAVFGLLSVSARATLDNPVTDTSGVVVGMTQRQAAALDQTARTDALVADVLFVAGGVLAATGVLLFALAPRPAAAVSVVVGPSSVGVVGRF